MIELIKIKRLKILKIRGKAMQSSVPQGEGGMVAVLGSKIEIVEKMIEENQSKYECFIANDNSDGQIVLSGKINDLEKMMIDLKAAVVVFGLIPTPKHLLSFESAILMILIAFA